MIAGRFETLEHPVTYSHGKAYALEQRVGSVGYVSLNADEAESLADRFGGVALGTDMDGGFGPGDLPVGLDHPRKLDALAEALRDAGWSDGEVEGFAYGNWLRLLSRVLA